MNLRSGRDLGDIKRFNFSECSKKQGEFIRSGGLRHFSSCVQQVNKKSYENLAKINELGLITVDSVDAEDTRPDDKHREIETGVHPTITGFISFSKLELLKQKYLTFMPNVCLIRHIIVEDLNSIDYKQIQMPVNYFYFGNRSGVQSMVRLYFSVEHILQFKKQVHLEPNEPVEFITMVDLRWKSKANSEKGLFTKLKECLLELENETTV